MSYLDDLLASVGGLLKPARPVEQPDPDRPSAPDRIGEPGQVYTPVTPQQQSSGSLLSAPLDLIGKGVDYVKNSLPQNVRDAYASAPAGAAHIYSEVSTPGAIRDTVNSLGDTTRSALAGEGWGTATNLLKAGGAAIGVIPGGKLVKKGLEKVAQEGVEAVGRATAKAAAGPKTASTIAENVPALAREAGDIRVSTRLPSGPKAYQDPLTHHLNIGLPEVINSETWAGKNQGLLAQWPGFREAARTRDPTAAANAYVNQASDNVRFLLQNAPDVIKKESPHWYEGANAFNRERAANWGVPEQSVHGMTAVLSPKRDWYQNASLSERTGDILAGVNKPMSPEMEGMFKNWPAMQPYKDRFDRIKGARLSDIEDPGDKALWVMLHDATHNPQSFRTMEPTGLLGDWAMTGGKTPQPQMIGSPSLVQMEKAIRSFESGGDMNVISPLLGDAHKVRNFYNNMAVPHDTRFGDVTVDTHQVAANMFQPLSLKSPAVNQNFGSHLGIKDQPDPMRGYAPWRGPASSSREGISGTYGLNVEPLRIVAPEFGLLPRAGQSVGWDTVRPLFEQLKASGRGGEAEAIWKAVDRGNITADEARKRIVELAGGFKDPDWAVPRGLLAGKRPTSTYR